MRIKSVTIENFKRFDSLQIDFGSFDCLVGPNNSGKTTLLQAMALFDFCVHHCLSRTNGHLSLKRRTVSPEDFYVLPMANPLDLWTDRITAVKNKQRIVKIEVRFDNDNQVTSKVKLDYNRFGISVDSSDESAEWLSRMAQYRIAYLPVFSVFLPREERRTAGALEDELMRGRVNGVIRNLLVDLKAAGGLGQLVDVLQKTLPGIEQLGVEFDEVSDRYISVTYKEMGRQKALDIFSGGAGFQQFLYLFGFIFLRKPSVILLDEPDVHLHGTLQRVLVDELKSLVAEGKQIIVATHSRDLIARFSPENLVSLDEPTPKRLKVSFDVYDALDRLGSIDSTQLPVLQAFRRVLLLEDRTDRDLLAVFCSCVLGSALWQQVERRLAFCFSRGNPRSSDAGRLRQQFQELVSMPGHTLKMFVVADRDYHPDIRRLRESLPNQHIQWHIWDRVEIENYLLSESAICRLVFSRGNDLTLWEGALRQEFNRLIEESRDRASDRLVKAFQDFGKECGEAWDATTCSRRAREFLNEKWHQDKLALADAKDVVLPGIKRWLQSQGLGQFSDKSLGQELRADELPDEVRALSEALRQFAGV